MDAGNIGARQRAQLGGGRIAIASGYERIRLSAGRIALTLEQGDVVFASICPGLYAAGDVVLGLDQISHVMGEGGVGATTIRNDLAAMAPLRH